MRRCRAAFSIVPFRLWHFGPYLLYLVFSAYGLIHLGKLDRGFVWALEILESLEKPWNFFIMPWKISQNLIEKINSRNGAFC